MSEAVAEQAGITEADVRHLAVCDTRTWEIVPGWVPRPLLELIQGGKVKADKGGKKNKDRDERRELVDYARMLDATGKAISAASDNGGANARATIETQRELIKTLSKVIEERDSSIQNRDAAHRVAMMEMLDLVKRVTGESMKQLVAETQEKIAIIESKTTQLVVSTGREMFEKFSTGPLGTALAKRFILPATNADAADAGGGGGRGALLRAVSKIGANDVLMEALSDVVGAADWQAAIEYVFSLSEQTAPEN